MRNNIGMLGWLLGDYLPEPPPQQPGTSGTGYGPSNSAPAGNYAPWWTGTTDEFMGGMGPLGPEMTEQDARWMLHHLNQSYQQYGGRPMDNRKPDASVPWGNGGGRPNYNVPPQNNTHTPIDTGMSSRGSGFGAAYRRRRGLMQPEE